MGLRRHRIAARTVAQPSPLLAGVAAVAPAGGPLGVVELPSCGYADHNARTIQIAQERYHLDHTARVLRRAKRENRRIKSSTMPLRSRASSIDGAQ